MNTKTDIITFTGVKIENGNGIIIEKITAHAEESKAATFIAKTIKQLLKIKTGGSQNG